MKKERIGDGQVQTPVPLPWYKRLTKMDDLFVPEPQEVFLDVVKGIRVYAKKNPRRIKMKLKQNTSCGFSRSLSFEELAAAERKLVAAGENIETKYCNMEVKKMSNEVEARLEKLYEVISQHVATQKYFKSSMLKGALGHKSRKYITDDEKYFERNIRDDLTRLRKKGLIYSRGRPPSWYLGSDEQFQEDKPKEMSPATRSIQIPEKIVIEVNVNVTFS